MDMSLRRSVRSKKIRDIQTESKAMIEAIMTGRDPLGFTVKFINDNIGKGVFTERTFLKGSFLLEYKGDLISASEGDHREEELKDTSKGSFMFFFIHKSKKMCIDATEDPFELSTARMVNDEHKSPNCVMRTVVVQERPHLCLFATREILPKEELRYDYGIPDLPWRKEPERKGHQSHQTVNPVNLDDLTFSGLKKKVFAFSGVEDNTKPVQSLMPDVEEHTQLAATSSVDDRDQDRGKLVAADISGENVGTAENDGCSDENTEDGQLASDMPTEDNTKSVQSLMPDVEEHTQLAATSSVEDRDQDRGKLVAADISGENVGTAENDGCSDENTEESQLASDMPTEDNTKPVQSLMPDVEEHTQLAATSSVEDRDQDRGKLVAADISGENVGTAENDGCSDENTEESQLASDMPTEDNTKPVQSLMPDVEEHTQLAATSSVDDRDQDRGKLVAADISGENVGTAENDGCSDENTEESQLASDMPTEDNTKPVQSLMPDVEEHTQLAVTSSVEDRDQNRGKLVAVDISGENVGTVENDSCSDESTEESQQASDMPTGNVFPIHMEKIKVQWRTVSTVQDSSISTCSPSKGGNPIIVEDSDSSDSFVIPPINDFPALRGAKRKLSDDEENDVVEPDSSTSHQTIPTIKKSAGQKVDYNKTHSCYYCGKMQKKISRHLTSHVEESAIVKLPTLDSSGSPQQKCLLEKRRIIFNTLRNLGDFVHNVGTLNEKSGILLVGRRPQAEGKLQWDNYLPCRFCLVFLTKKELWRHAKRCSFRNMPLQNFSDVSGKSERTFTKECQLLLYGAGVTPSCNDHGPDNAEFYRYIVDSFQIDDVSKTIKQDSLLMQFGKILFFKLGRERAGDVRSRLRLLGRLKLSLQNITKKTGSIGVFLNPSDFNHVVTATKVLVGISESKTLNGTVKFDRPSTALKVGQFLRKITVIKHGISIKEQDDNMRKATSDFLTVYDAEWIDQISSLARQSAAEVHFNKKDYLPLTEDLVKLKLYMDEQLQIEVPLLRKTQNPTTWKSVARLTLAKLILFNKRRGEEPAKVLRSSYSERPSWKTANQEILQTLKPIEQVLMKQMDLVEVIGKKNRKVPLLLPPLTKQAIDALLETRKDDNPFLFPQGQSHMHGGDALRKICLKADLKQPELITSTRLRKYMATVSQVIGMSEMELQELARHMGHELAVHRKFYRLQEDVTELAKVSKLLLAVESGQAHRYNGLSLDDIDFNDLDNMIHTDRTEVPVSVGPGEGNGRSTECEGQTADETVTHCGGENVRTADSMDSQMGLDKEGTCSTEGVHHPLLRGKRKKYTEDCVDSDDSEFNPGTDSEDEIILPKKDTKNKVIRTKWTDEEKHALEDSLMVGVRKTKKPPTKTDIVKAQKQNKSLLRREWKKIKFQCWAIFQSEDRKKKKTASKLLT